MQKQHVAAWCVLLLAIGMVWVVLWGRDPMRVHRLTVVSDCRWVRPEFVAQRLQPFLKQNFFALPLETMRVSLLAEMPWVSSVRLSRMWPPALRVTLLEREVVARWGEDAWLSRDAVVLRPPGGGPKHLVRLGGPEDQADLILSFYEQSKRLGVPGHPVTRVQVNDRHVWTVWLAGGLRVDLGRVNRHARWARFVRVIAALRVKQFGKALVFDMRYPNGFVMRKPGHV